MACGARREYSPILSAASGRCRSTSARMVPEGRGLALLAIVTWAVACGPSQEVAGPAGDGLAAPAGSTLASGLALAVVELVSCSPSGRASRSSPSTVDRAGFRRSARFPWSTSQRAGEVAPDMILWPGTPAGEEPLAEALRSAGREVVVVQPHSLEEAFVLCRDLGSRLVGTARARSFEIALSRQLAAIGGASFGRLRPRVAAVIGVAAARVRRRPQLHHGPDRDRRREQRDARRRGAARSRSGRSS